MNLFMPRDVAARRLANWMSFGSDPSLPSVRVRYVRFPHLHGEDHRVLARLSSSTASIGVFEYRVPPSK